MMVEKQRAIRLNLNRTFDEKVFKGDVGKIYEDGRKKKSEVNYTPAMVFTENRNWSRFKFWKHRRNIILFVEGALKALLFGKTTRDLQTHWTKTEAKVYCYKMVAKALQEFKQLKFYQFILLMIPQIIILIIALRIATSVGAF